MKKPCLAPPAAQFAFSPSLWQPEGLYQPTLNKPSTLLIYRCAVKLTDKQMLLELLKTQPLYPAEISGATLYRWMREHRLPPQLDRAFDEAQAAAHTDLDPQFIIIQVTP